MSGCPWCARDGQLTTRCLHQPTLRNKAAAMEEKLRRLDHLIARYEEDHEAEGLSLAEQVELIYWKRDREVAQVALESLYALVKDQWPHASQ